MRRMQEEIRDVRVPSEALARWALETPVAAQEATCAALAFLVHAEHAASTLLPVPKLLRSEKAVLDPDGFLRQPRGAVEHYWLRTTRAMGWMDLFIFFRERFPAAAERQPPESLYALANVFQRHEDELDAAVDLLVRECVMPEIEDLLSKTLTYPPLQVLVQRLRDSDPQRSADSRRLAAAVLGELTGTRLWRVRTRLVTASTRALLAAKPLLDELERGGFKVDRTRAARGFAAGWKRRSPKCRALPSWSRSCASSRATPRPGPRLQPATKAPTTISGFSAARRRRGRAAGRTWTCWPRPLP